MTTIDLGAECICCGTRAKALRIIADHFDMQDALKKNITGEKPSTEVQDDLREWAENIEGMSSNAR